MFISFFYFKFEWVFGEEDTEEGRREGISVGEEGLSVCSAMIFCRGEEDLREGASIGELQQRAEVVIGERRSATEDGGDV